MPQITVRTRVIDNRRHSAREVPGTVIDEPNDLTCNVEWDDSAGVPDVVFVHELSVFATNGSAR